MAKKRILAKPYRKHPLLQSLPKEIPEGGKDFLRTMMRDIQTASYQLLPERAIQKPDFISATRLFCKYTGSELKLIEKRHSLQAIIHLRSLILPKEMFAPLLDLIHLSDTIQFLPVEQKEYVAGFCFTLQTHKMIIEKDLPR